MGCTSSMPAPPKRGNGFGSPGPVSQDSKKDTPPSVATDNDQQPSRAASSTQNPASAVTSTIPVSNPTPMNKGQKDQDAMFTKVAGVERANSGSMKLDQPRPAAPANDQPPMKRVAIVESRQPEWSSQRSIPSVASSAAAESDGSESPPKPRRLDDYYEVDRTKRIGKGHYASVFVGKNKVTGQRVAVKMVEKRLSKTERLALEVSVMRKAGAHPNIVQLIDVFETDNQLQLVLELVEGGELFEYLVEHGPYSEATAAMHIRDVTRAIAFLHSQNIIHRDLKPENILLTSKDDTAKVKVADFGLAKLMVADVTRTVCGTWAYCAYEVKKPGGAYDNKCDMWSIGVIAYILLSAYHPFDPQGDATDDEIWEKISRADYNYNDPAWNNVSDTAKDFVSKLLVLDPKQRLSAEEALQHPWLREVAEAGAHEDKEHPEPALSPAINDKLANFQVRSKAAMNPLQKAAAAMKSRVGSWKSSSVSSTGSGNAATAASSTSAANASGSPSWKRRSMVIAAAAAAAAARSAKRGGGGGGVLTPTNASEGGSDKPRSWSSGSNKTGSSSPAMTAVAAVSNTGMGDDQQTPSLPSPHGSNPSAPLVSSPLKTVALVALPSEETLLTPVTPGAFPVGEGEEEEEEVSKGDDGEPMLAASTSYDESAPEASRESAAVQLSTIQMTQTSEAVAAVVPIESPVIAGAAGSTGSAGEAEDDDDATMPSEGEEVDEREQAEEEEADATFMSAQSDQTKGEASAAAESEPEASFMSARSEDVHVGSMKSKSSKRSHQ